MTHPPHVILMVDDDWMNREVFQLFLERAGYRVLAADSGAAALALAQTERPDLAFIDVRLGDLDGFAVCAQLKADETTCHIPVVLVTAMEIEAERVRALQAGADDFLSKTMGWSDMIARIARLLST